MLITFLGTSGCIPTETRGLPAVHIEYLGEPMLFDCGEGTQRQMRLAGLNFMAVDNIFLTHLHADHFMGLGGMLQSMDFLERVRPLTIHGPYGTSKVIESLLSIGTFRKDHLMVNVNEVREGIVYNGKRYAVTAARTEHTKNSLAYCLTEKPYRHFQKQKALDLGIPEGRLFGKLQNGEEVTFDGKTYTPDDVLSEPILGRKVVYSGDTRACESVMELSRDADVLIHESMFAHVDVEATRDAAHSTTVQAAEIAKRANVKALYLLHFSQRYTEPEKLLEEARSVFPNSHIAEDFMQVKVEKHW